MLVPRVAVAHSHLQQFLLSAPRSFTLLMPSYLLFLYLHIIRLQAMGFMPTDHTPLGLVDEDFALGNYANPGFCDLRDESLFTVEVPVAS
jgi:hypothetical protein